MARKRSKKPTLDDRLELRMTALEKRTFEEAARRFGVSLSHWLRLAAWQAIKEHGGKVQLVQTDE